MMTLNGFINEEVSDIGYLGTLSELNDVLSQVGQLPVNNPKRIAFIKRVQGLKSRSVPNKGLTAKAEFEKRIIQLPKEIQEDLRGNRKQIVDGNLYSAKAIAALTNLELMANADTKSIGVTNVNNRKLEAGQYFLLTAICLTYGVEASVIASAYAVCSSAILNGEFQLKVGTEVLIPEVSVEIFNTTGRTDVRPGMYVLENPKWIVPQTEIIPEIDIPAAGITNANLKIQLIGATMAKK